MRIHQFFFLLLFFVVASFFSQSVSSARQVYPWPMFLPGIINGNSDRCADDALIFGRYLPTGKNCDVITDTVNNLEWQRCSIGQTWNPLTKNCDGTTTGFTWYQANALVPADGWRVPTVTELRSLVYCSTGDPILIEMDLYDITCNGNYARPTIISEAFPNVPYVDNSIRAHYWTSSSNDLDPGMAWVVNFYKGNVGDDGTKFSPGLSIRLVRTPAN